MTSEPQKIETDPVDDIWAQATQRFSNAKAMRLRLSWLTGVSVDTASDRIQRLLKQPSAAVLRDALDKLDSAALRRFCQRANINLERAAAAMRLNLVVNVSVPVGALVIVNQLFPKMVSGFVEEFGMESVVLASVALLFFVLFSLWYSYCAVTQARDLAHLTRLFVADRLEGSGASQSDYNDEPLDPAELA